MVFGGLRNCRPDVSDCGEPVRARVRQPLRPKGRDHDIASDGLTMGLVVHGISETEALTDDLAAPPYDVLEPSELDRLIAGLGPLVATLVAVGSS
jgi:hypothetical protein